MMPRAPKDLTLREGREVRLVKKPGRKRGRYEIRKMEQDRLGTLITVWGPLRCNGQAGYHYVRECDIIVR